MAYQIAFSQETFRPKTIEGNETALDPVEFDLSAVQGPSLALLKGLMFGSAFLSFSMQPSEKDLQSAAAGLASAGPAFVEGVDAVRGLTIPDNLARRLGLRKADDPSTAPFAVTTGPQFARVAMVDPALGFEVGFKIVLMSEQHGAGIDPRLFGLPTTSPANDSPSSGTVRGARRTNGRAGIAGSRRRKVN